MNSIERIQYQEALAITGAWKGTNLNKIYEELGWESLTDRRWSRRLIHFYKIQNNYIPRYLKFHRRGHTCMEFALVTFYEKLLVKLTVIKKSFYPHCIKSWNEIGTEFREAVSLSVFNTNILKLIRPPYFMYMTPKELKDFSDSCWPKPLKISQEEI